MPDGLDRNLKLLPDYINQAGYSSHMVGKWHLGQGHEYDMPWNKGFDSFLGILEAQTNYFTHKMGKVHTLRKDFLAQIESRCLSQDNHLYKIKKRSEWTSMETQEIYYGAVHRPSNRYIEQFN